MRSEDFFRRPPRSDRRHWAKVRPRGPLVARGRTPSSAPAPAATGSAGAAHTPPPFAGRGPREWGTVRGRLARQTTREPPKGARVPGTSPIPEQGSRSAGAARFGPGTGRAMRRAAPDASRRTTNGVRALPQ